MGRLLTSVHPRPTQIHSSFGTLDALTGNESAQSAVHELLAIAADKDLQRSLVEQLEPLLSKFPNLQRGLQPLKQFVNNTRVPSWIGTEMRFHRCCKFYPLNPALWTGL